MMLEDLINEGKKLKNHLISDSMVPAYVDVEFFEKWKTKAILFLKDYNEEVITNNFIEASQNNLESNWKKSLGILIGLKEFIDSNN